MARTICRLRASCIMHMPWTQASTLIRTLCAQACDTSQSERFPIFCFAKRQGNLKCRSHVLGQGKCQNVSSLSIHISSYPALLRMMQSSAVSQSTHRPSRTLQCFAHKVANCTMMYSCIDQSGRLQEAMSRASNSGLGRCQFCVTSKLRHPVPI